MIRAPVIFFFTKYLPAYPALYYDPALAAFVIFSVKYFFSPE